MSRPIVFCLVILAGVGAWRAYTQQTQIDLKTQSKSVDFTGADYTKPIRTGTVLPAACGVGEAFFLLNSPAGANLYLCPSQNSWALQGASVSGTSSVTIAVGGVIQGMQPTLNLNSGLGILLSCANNPGAMRVDCMAVLDTAYAPSRAMDQAGTDHSVLATSSGMGGSFASSSGPALSAYNQNQSFNFVPVDHDCTGSDTININALGPVPLKVLSSGVLTPVAAGGCKMGVGYIILAIGSPVNSFRLI
jgi:hypothetical protein